jgi:hypothetical protein
VNSARLRTKLAMTMCFALLCPTSSIGLETDQKAIINQARRAYYNLANEGLQEFRCEVLPNWDSAFQALNADQVGKDQVLPILRKTHFQLVVGPHGASTVSHQSELAPPNEEVAERVRKAIAGMEQIITGFLQTWSQFNVNLVPLPDANSDFQWEDAGELYRINFKEGSADASILLRRDFQIQELKVVTSQLSGIVQPKFSSFHNRFVLESYRAIFELASNPRQELSVHIEYDEREHLHLPSRVVATTKLPNAVAEFSFAFTNYHIKKK